MPAARIGVVRCRAPPATSGPKHLHHHLLRRKGPGAAAHQTVLVDFLEDLGHLGSRRMDDRNQPGLRLRGNFFRAFAAVEDSQDLFDHVHVARRRLN